MEKRYLIRNSHLGTENYPYRFKKKRKFLEKILEYSFFIILISSLAILCTIIFKLSGFNQENFPLTGKAVFSASQAGENQTFVTINFSNEIGTIREDFYGIDNNGKWFGEQGDKLIGIYMNSTQDVYSNANWNKQALLDFNIGYIKEMPFMDSYYKGIQGDAENWAYGTSYYVNSSLNYDCNIPFGLSCAGYNLNSSNFAIISQSSDKHSGSYSVNITTFNSDMTKEVWNFYSIILPFNHFYNFSLWLKSKNDSWLRVVNDDQDLVNCSKANSGSGNWEQVSCAINYTSSKGYVSGTEWRIDIGHIHGGESTLWDDFQITQDGVPYQYQFYGDITPAMNNIKFSYDNNKKVLMRIDYMPEFLANISELCKDRIDSCPPKNYTLWGNLIVDWINRSTNNSQYISAIDAVEILNEPDLTAFLANLSQDNITKTEYYNKVYNASYWSVKNTYPQLAVGGPSGHDYSPNMLKGFLSNFSRQMDFISYHPYMEDYESNTDGMYNKTKWLFDLCKVYNANCSRMILSEWNVADVLIKNSSQNSKRFGANIALAYSDMLNNWPQNISSIYFEWSYDYKYSNTKNFREYPQRWSMVSEPALDNAYYPPYNITKNFATYHSAGSMVVKSNSSLGSIKVVASKKNDSQYITVINSGANASIILNISNNISNGIKDLETGENYSIENGIVQIGALPQYDIRYFVSFNTSSNISTNTSIPPPQQNETPAPPAPNMTQNQTGNNSTQNQSSPGGSKGGGKGKGKIHRLISNIIYIGSSNKNVSQTSQNKAMTTQEYSTTKTSKNILTRRAILTGESISENFGNSPPWVKFLLFSLILSIIFAFALATYLSKIIYKAVEKIVK